MSQSELADYESSGELLSEHERMVVECSDPERPYRDKELLKELYSRQELSSKYIGELFDCSPTTVMVWVRKFDLPEGYARLGPAKFYMHDQGYILAKNDSELPHD